jgi:hypothetical protein
MFKDPFSNKYLGIVFTVPNDTENKELVYVFPTPFILRKLELDYKGEFLIHSHILSNITLSGISNDELK